MQCFDDFIINITLKKVAHYNSGSVKNSYLYEYINPSKPSGNYMYHQFNIQQFYVLPSVFTCSVWI